MSLKLAAFGSELIDTVLEFTHFLTVKVHLTTVNKV